MLPFLSRSQFDNLVVNPSFEISQNFCPAGANNLHILDDWYNFFYGSYHSPGVFSPCGGINTGNSSTPYNICGYQVPKTGDNYGFGLMYSLLYDTHCYYAIDCNDSLRAMEPLSGTFTTPLTNSTYYLEFYLSKCDKENENDIATDAFDLVLHYDTLGYLHPYEPWIKQSDIVWSNPSGNIIRDTMHWVKLSGCFEAKGGEKYFSIGSFRSPELYQHEGLDVFPNKPNLAAYYFDDFLIRECDTCCLDTNPVQDYIQLNGNPVVTGEPPVFEVFLNPGHTADIKVFDAAGRIVYESKIQSSGQHQMPYGLARAVYSYALINNEDEIYSGKFVVN